jgi:hypothetical protein
MPGAPCSERPAPVDLLARPDQVEEHTFGVLHAAVPLGLVWCDYCDADTFISAGHLKGEYGLA